MTKRKGRGDPVCNSSTPLSLSLSLIVFPDFSFISFSVTLIENRYNLKKEKRKKEKTENEGEEGERKISALSALCLSLSFGFSKVLHLTHTLERLQENRPHGREKERNKTRDDYGRQRLVWPFFLSVC